MILRKPYAFLIKHFRLLHLILVAPMIYLLVRTNVLMEFINEYTASPSLIIGGEYQNTLFSIPMFILNFFIILVAIVLIAVMYNKKKPFVYYIFTVFVYLALFILYNYTYSVVGQMQTSIVDSRLTRGVGDILLIAYLIQLLNVIQTAIRATGFDIKKFNFREDLEELNISSEDSEEFEFEMKINTTKIASDLKKNFRFFKYAYIENKLIIDCIGLAITVALTYFIYLNIAANNKYYAQDSYFTAGRYNLKVDDVYVTDKDYLGNKIDGDSAYVIVRVDISNKFRDDEKLNTGLFQLAIGDDVYYHDNEARVYFTDIGTVYNNFDVPMEETEYLFVYKIPYEQRSDKMYFRYLNNANAKGQLKARYLKVKLDVEDLTQIKNAINKNYGEQLVFDNSLLLKSSLNITSIDVADSFNAKYDFCADANTCYESLEIIRPAINTNYDKALVRIKGNVNIDKDVSIKGISSLYGFLSKYATIDYVVDGNYYSKRITSRVEPTKFNSSAQYIEVNSDILRADGASLKITVRNNIYVYKIK